MRLRIITGESFFVPLAKQRDLVSWVHHFEYVQRYRGAISSYPTVFSVSSEHHLLSVLLLKAVLLLVFYCPVEPLYPGFEDTFQHCFVDLNDNFSNHLQEVVRFP